MVGLHIATYGSNKLGPWIQGAAIPVTVTAIVITAIDPIVSWPIFIPTSSNRPGWQRPKVTHDIITANATRKGHKLFKNSTEFEAFKICVYIKFISFLWVLCVYYTYIYISLYIIHYICMRTLWVIWHSCGSYGKSTFQTGKSSINNKFPELYWIAGAHVYIYIYIFIQLRTLYIYVYIYHIYIILYYVILYFTKYHIIRYNLCIYILCIYIYIMYIYIYIYYVYIYIMYIYIVYIYIMYNIYIYIYVDR